MKNKIIGVIVSISLFTATVSIAESSNDRSESTIIPTIKNIIQPCEMINWTEKQKLLIPDGQEQNVFGSSVSVYREYAVIGSYGEDTSRGAAYIFKYSDAGWTQEAKLLASDGTTGDRFGWSVSIYGEYAFVGTYTDYANPGSVYVFKRTGTTWIQKAKLRPADSTIWDFFGWSVSINDQYAIIGSIGGFEQRIGSAYIFKHSDAGWTEEAKLLASDGQIDDQFGYSVSIYSEYAAIGAYWADTGRGSAYIFKHINNDWTQMAKLLASDGSTWDHFGCSVSIYGEHVVIGAVGDDSGNGSAYVFKRTNSEWTQETKLLISYNNQSGLGCSVSIYKEYAIIGAYGEYYARGAAYVFKHSDTGWTQEDHFVTSDGQMSDYFGGSVSIYGRFAFIGANGDDYCRGSTYVFLRLYPNQPPNTPTITGPVNGKARGAIEYNFTTTDPDDDDVYYFIDWGDETNSSWINPYLSGDIIPQSHTWSNKGNYTIKAKAKDFLGTESGWGILQINITSPIEITIKGGFGVSVIIYNNGTTNLTNLTWTITLNGNRIFFGQTKTGSIPTLAPWASIIVRDLIVFGIGKTGITAKVEDTEANAIGTIFLFFVIGVT